MHMFTQSSRFLLILKGMIPASSGLTVRFHNFQSFLKKLHNWEFPCYVNGENTPSCGHPLRIDTFIISHNRLTSNPLVLLSPTWCRFNLYHVLQELRWVHWYVWSKAPPMSRNAINATSGFSYSASNFVASWWTAASQDLANWYATQITSILIEFNANLTNSCNLSLDPENVNIYGII